MSRTLQQYTDIIHIQSRLLMDSNKTYLSMAQRQAIELINRYSAQLVTSAKQAAPEDKHYDSVRHELINILTPIVGYIEMLSDGWIGKLNPDQVAHIDIIRQSVFELRRVILAYRAERAMSESA